MKYTQNEKIMQITEETLLLFCDIVTIQLFCENVTMEQEKITLTKAELKKVLVVEKLVARQIKVAEAATLLGLSTRQVLRLKKIYLEKGAQGIAHQNRGRKPVHAIPDTIKEHVAELYRSKYYGSNNCHFAELLQEHESITLSVSSVRRILLAKGIKQPKQRRRGKFHQPRSRKTASRNALADRRQFLRLAGGSGT